MSNPSFYLLKYNCKAGGNVKEVTKEKMPAVGFSFIPKMKYFPSTIMN